MLFGAIGGLGFGGLVWIKLLALYYRFWVGWLELVGGRLGMGFVGFSICFTG